MHACGLPDASKLKLKKRNRLMLWVKSMKKREEDRGRFQNGFSLLSLTCMSGTRDISLLEAIKNEKHY